MRKNNTAPEKQGKKKQSKATTAAIIISSVIIIICGVVIGMSLASLHGEEQNDVQSNVHNEPPKESVSAEQPTQEPESGKITLTTYILDASSCSTLSKVVGLAETNDPYGTTPAYVFIGKKYVTEKTNNNEQTSEENDTQEDPSEGDFQEETKSEQEGNRQMLATRELLNVAKDAASEWNIPYEELSSFLSQCICIHSDQYIIVIGNDRYAPLAQIFEAAIDDPSVLDMEDLISRLSSFQSGG